jgi:hypothetical protein
MEYVSKGGNVDVSSFTPQQMNTLRKVFHTGNRFMVWMWKMGWGKFINIWPAGFGRIMVIRHRGRRSGRDYLIPVNYAIVDGEIYCTAGFGSISDWYRNMLANPRVELWLPGENKWFYAEDFSDSPRRLFLLRQVIIASGFAGPLFGINPKNLDDAKLDAVSKDYRLIRLIKET